MTMAGLGSVWRAAVAGISMVLVALTGHPMADSSPAAPAVPTASHPCGTASQPPATYDHVVWIWMENHSYGSIVGSTQAPYLNGLIATCGLATNYHNITHPSLPNYVAATSGLGYSKIAKFHSDCSPSQYCSTDARSIFDQAPSWAAYEESMPSNCLIKNSGQYAVRHNPPPYYTALAGCATDDVPYTQLATDLGDGTLPAFSFVTPNLCDDMHNCPVASGDAWLKAQLPAVLSSAEYAAGGMAVFITWDEGAGGSSNQCAENQTDQGCHVATIVISPSTPKGATSDTLFNHYSLLRTTEEMLGIGHHLGKAATATSMRSAFNL
jgi:phospholipase C